MRSWYFLLILFYSVQALHSASPISFAIIVPSYNNSAWYKKNLDSIFEQTYQNYRIIYIDDCSEDETASLVEQYVQEHNKQAYVTLIKNSKRQFKLANMYTAVHQCADHEVIIELDGDDWFSNTTVLAYLASLYEHEEVWLTYGNHVKWPSGERSPCRPLPAYVIKANGYREFPWVTSALRTFRAWLFKNIKREDLEYNGEFFRVSADIAYMYPMLEMAGFHSYFISNVLYIYNVSTQLNDFKLRLAEQLSITHLIRARPRYERLDTFER